jgi:metallophosphoesterase superfamily enzyme
MIVGDMFHSVYNHEIAHFASWRDRYRGLEIYLAKGNHDILAADIYHSLNIKVGRTYTFGDIAFSHDLCADISCFCFNGHIHPGIRIVSNARQQLKFSCFHFSGMNCTLPAFSLFTGLSIISPLPDDKVYMIVDDEVIPV